MASFYIGIPCAGDGVTVPVGYFNNSPRMLIYNNGTETFDASTYNDRPLSSAPYVYAVHFLDAFTELNPSQKAYAHNYNGAQTHNIYNHELLPPGTKVWEMEENPEMLDAYYIDYYGDGFGDEGDNGQYVNVNVFKSPITLYSGGGYNNWFYADGKYRFFGNTSNLWKSYSFTAYAGHTYTFNLKTYSEYNYDGIIISTSSLSSGSVQSAGQARAHGVYGTNSTSTSTWTYTPSSNTTIYFYFKTNSGTLKGPASAIYANATIDYTYGEIQVIDSSPQANTISYSPYNNTCYTSSSSQQVYIASSSSCLAGTLSFTTSRWSISLDGRYLTIPANTVVGTYGVTITVTSPNVGNYYSVTETKSITITIAADTIIWGTVYLVDSGGICFDEGFTYAGCHAIVSEGSNGDTYWDVIYDGAAETDVVGTGVIDTTPAEPIEYVPTFFETKVDEPGPGSTEYTYHYLPASAYTVNGNNIEDYVEVYVKAIQSYSYSSDPYTLYWTEINNKSWSGSISGNSLGTTETGYTYVNPSGMSLIFYPYDSSDIEVPLNTGEFILTRDVNIKTRTSGDCWYNGSRNFPAAGGTITFNKSNVSVLEEFSYSSGATSSNTTVNSFSCQRTSTTSGWGFTESGSSSNYTYTVSAPANNSTNLVTNGCVIRFNINTLQKDYTFTQSGKIVPTLNLVADPADTAKVTVNTAGTVYWGTSSSSMTNTKSISANTQTTLTSTSGGTSTIYVYFVPTDTGNFTSLGNSSTPTANVTITKKIAITGTAPTLVSGTLTYNTNPQALVNAGTVSTGGVLYYYSSTSSSTPSWNNGTGWSTSVPSQTDAGTYYVWYYVYVSDTSTYGPADSGNYNSINTAISLSSKAIGRLSITSITPSTTSSSRKVIYDRSEYNTFTITVSPSGATVNFTSGNTGRATVSSAGLVTYNGAGTVNITVTGTGNYTGTKTCYVNCVVDTEGSTQYKNNTCTQTGVNITAYGIPTVSIGSGLVAGRYFEEGGIGSYDGGSATVTASVTNTTQWYQKWASGYVQSHTGTQAGDVNSGHVNLTMTTNGNNRFTLTGTTIEHDWMADYTGTDTVTIKATNAGSSSKYTTTSASVTNYLTIGNVTLTVNSPATPYPMAVSGETKAISASASQTGTYSSGSTDTYTPEISYTVKTAKTGYSLGTGTDSNKVTVTNNTSTSARNGFVVTVTATGVTGTDSTYISGYNKTATSDRTFNQAAGSKSYGTPTVTFTYTNTGAGGASNKTPSAMSYSQLWTWNGVSGSGGNITSGLTVGYTTTGTLPSGFSTGTNFATTGAITWANRGTTVGSQRNANSNIVLSISFADGTRTYNPTGCTQTANALTSISISVANNPIDYNEQTTCSVSATYTSSSSKDITGSLTVNASSGNRIVVSDTTIITMV